MSEHRNYQFIRNTRPLSPQDLLMISKLNQFQDIVVFPVNAKIEIDQKLFFEYFDQNKKEIHSFNANKLWTGIQAITGPHVSSPIHKKNDDFFALFPTLMNQIHEVFPFLDIHTFHFWEQICDIPSHQDGVAADLNYYFPWSYRIIFREDTYNNFYVEPIRGENQLPYQLGKSYQQPQIDEKKFLVLPETSNVFCFNNSACKHGSLMPKGRKVVGFLDAEINFNKHYEIILEALEKFPDYIVRKNLHG